MKPEFTCLTAASRTLLSVGLLSLTLISCSKPTSTVLSASSSPATDKVVETSEVATSSTTTESLWSDGFEEKNWQEKWRIVNRGSWGLKNMEVMENPKSKFPKFLRVRYPAGSTSPTVTKDENAPVGGSQFLADLGMQPRDSLRLSYYVRFSDNFDFVKGGKLPGLFGGKTNTGRKIPDGTDGFSTRYMWRRDGDGEVYAYLPTSREHGTSIGRGNWRFQPGTWHHLEQEVILNKPGQSNGRIRVWVDGKQVLDRDGVNFRTTDNLKIEGILFSTFFGGGDSSWATPKDVYADFANFSVASVNSESR